jgi:hypothetical protein
MSPSGSCRDEDRCHDENARRRFSPETWARRTTLSIDDGTIDLMSLPDLVQAKKTQCDKDWPMLRRLLEVHYFANRENPTHEQIRFWLLELRTPD